MGLNQDITTYFENLKVAVHGGETFYLDTPPSNPHLPYPEYAFKDDISPSPNLVYDAVRNCFKLLELDKGNIGSSGWNLLREIIGPGNKVVIKPNLLVSPHYEDGNLYSIVTHPSILRGNVE